ncbi:hypothetical protein ACWA16_13510 [Bacillus subtilis]
MESKVNMLRILEFYMGETGNFKKVVVIQEIYRNNPSKMKGCELSFLKDNKFVAKGFFEAETIMVRNSFHSYNSELPELKEHHFKKMEKRDQDSHYPVSETTVLYLSGYVFAEFKFHKIANDKKIGDKVYLPIKLDDKQKPDSNEFCKLLVLEEYRDGTFELPELPKRAEMFTCWVRLELAPDSKNDSGVKVSEREFNKARMGEIKGNIA